MAPAVVMVFVGGVTDGLRVRLIGSVILVCLAITTVLNLLSTAIVLLSVAIFLLRLMGQGLMSQTAMGASAAALAILADPASSARRISI